MWCDSVTHLDDAKKSTWKWIGTSGGTSSVIVSIPQCSSTSDCSSWLELWWQGQGDRATKWNPSCWCPWPFRASLKSAAPESCRMFRGYSCKRWWYDAGLGSWKRPGRRYKQLCLWACLRWNRFLLYPEYMAAPALWLWPIGRLAGGFGSLFYGCWGRRNCRSWSTWWEQPYILGSSAQKYFVSSSARRVHLSAKPQFSVSSQKCRIISASSGVLQVCHPLDRRRGSIS